MLPLSPPVSPASKNISTADSPSLVTRDPILYPNVEVPSVSSSQVPLFDNEALAAQRVVKEHVAARKSSLFREGSPPRQSEYELALEFKSQVVQAFARSNPRTWFERERAQLLEDQAMRSGVRRRYPVLAPAAVGRPPRGILKNSEGRGAIVKPVRPPRQPVIRPTP